MDTSLVASETVDLLSRITGQKLSQRDLTPPVIFLANLVTVLLGVMFADGTVSEEEKQRWQKIINKFIPSEGNVRQLTQLMSKGVRQNQIYKTRELLTLTTPLSESEKLLLIGFGYEMAAADGEIATSEKKYLEIVAKLLKIKPEYLVVLEAGFTNQGILDPAALDEVIFLLDPSRFHELDTLFVAAAADMLATLPAKPEHKETHKKRISSYEQLKDFQKYHKQLDNFCYQLFEIIQSCNNGELLSHNAGKELIEEITQVSRKLQSQKFRLAVVGEFSQGKSTLLNALLGEEIQPVRAIPCSGTVTVLKYGAHKRVICKHKDGRDEEISIDDYKIKAAISKEAAREHRTDELERSDIEEIIFEHPDLDLCRSGVEILDSPGLNEHPNRTAVTKKILEDADAAIFLTNAMRLLPEKEKELIQDVRNQLNDGRENEPAKNLFVLVNFMDCLEEDEDRQDVSQRLESYVRDKNLLIPDGNRIHYISAKAALKAVLAGKNDEHLKKFQSFTQSVENFLVLERGSIKIEHSVTEITQLIQKGLRDLHLAEDALNGKITLSETAKLEILEQIGEASGCDVRIKNLADQLAGEAIDEAVESWDEWLEGLAERMAHKSEYWHSEHSHIWSQKELIRDYTNQFMRDLQREIDEWGNTQLRDVVLKQNLELLDFEIHEELEALKNNLKLLDQQINTNLAQELNFKILGIAPNIYGAAGFMGVMGGAALAGGLLAFGIGLIPIITVAVAVSIAGSFGLGLLDLDGIHDQIKLKVFEQGFQKFEDSMEKIGEKLDEIISSAFAIRIKAADEAIQQIMSSYENLLEQQEKAHQQNLQERELEKTLITQKRQELEQVQKEIATLLT